MFLKRCKKNISMLLVLSIILTLLASSATNVSAVDEFIDASDIYVIKNVCSGKYLDVDHAKTNNGTNVLQWQYQGGNNQEWKIVYVQGGLYKIVSCLNNNKALTVVNTTGNNGVNITISDYVGTVAQHFVLRRTSKTSYKIITNASGYNSAVTVQNASCDNGANVFQWHMNGSSNEEWFIETKLSYNSKAGVDYAKKNYNQRIETYPDMSDMGGDCANFVSQCLVAGGYQYDGNWYVNKKNKTNLAPKNVNELNNTWSLADPSPWISAIQFQNFWSSKAHYETYKTEYVLENPDEIYHRSFWSGDVVQLLDKTLFGTAGRAKHTMYITSTGYYNGNKTFNVTQHTSDAKDVALLKICERNPGCYIRLYSFNT